MRGSAAYFEGGDAPKTETGRAPEAAAVPASQERISGVTRPSTDLAFQAVA